MESQTTDVHISVTWNGVLHTFQVKPYAYRSLMALIYDKIFIENFGECKGIGRCGTCHVHVLSEHPELLIRQGNEVNTLGKMPVTAANSRLSCHIPLDASVDGLHVEVVNDDDLGLY